MPQSNGPSADTTEPATGKRTVNRLSAVQTGKVYAWLDAHRNDTDVNGATPAGLATIATGWLGFPVPASAIRNLAEEMGIALSTRRTVSGEYAAAGEINELRELLKSVERRIVNCINDTEFRAAGWDEGIKVAATRFSAIEKYLDKLTTDQEKLVDRVRVLEKGWIDAQARIKELDDGFGALSPPTKITGAGNTAGKRK